MSSGDLAKFIETVSGDSLLSVEENFGNGFVRLRISEAQRRQAKHDIRCVEDAVIELLRNSRDAHASNIYISLNRSGSTREIVIIDDGEGIPPAIKDLVFEPRVTSKLDSMVMDKWGVHGRGMALYSIRENARSAAVVACSSGLGACVKVVFDLDQLPEKKDQSTFPDIDRDSSGAYTVGRGPHNIVRCITEFALDSSDELDVYLGTPTTLAALLYARGCAEITDEQSLFVQSAIDLPVPLRLATATDARTLIRASASLGLEIGERTAHRILAGQIEEAGLVLDKVLPNQERPSASSADIYKDSRGLRIADNDMRLFKSKLEESFDELAQTYFLNLASAPTVRVGKDAITVKFPIEKEL